MTKRFFIISLIWILWTGSVQSIEELRFVLIPLESPTTMYKRFLPLKRYLQERLSLRITLRVATDGEDILKQLREGKADLAFLCPTLYCRAAAESPLLPLIKLSVRGASKYRSAIVVRQDSDIKKTIDLRDRSFVYGRYQCPGSGLLPTVMLKRVGITEEGLFEVVKLGSDKSAVVSVLAKVFDATGVPESVAEKYADKGLRTVRYSYSIPQYLIAARKDLGVDLLANLRETFLEVNSSPSGSHIFESIGEGVDSFRPASDSEYDIVRALMNIPVPKGTDPISVIVEPVLSKVEILSRVGEMMNYLTKETGLRFRIIVPADERLFIERMKEGDGVLFLYSALFENDSETSLTRLAKVWIFGRDARFFLIRGENKGGEIAVASLMHNISGISKKRLTPVGTYEKVLLSVYNGNISMGLINSAVYEAFIDDLHVQKLSILRTVPLPTYWTLEAGYGVDQKIIDKIKKALNNYKGFPAVELYNEMVSS